METFVKSSVLNSLWSIWYCLVVIGFQSYITYGEIQRYLELRQEQWRASLIPPAELTAQLVLVIVSILCIPLFILACIFRTGNYANDGVKLGRDHALNSNMETVFRPVHFTFIRRIWRHFCPLAQTLHLMAALCLLLPDTLITAAGVYHKHRTKDAIWTTDLDFLFHPRKIYSSIPRSETNLSATSNITHFVGSHVLILPEQPVSLNFCYFTTAFFAFSTRYSAIFWYTNKVLSCIFALQLFWMTVHSLFTFCGMAILYKVAFNRWAYPDIPLLLPSQAVLGLYLAGGFILIISTITIFEYGLHFFEEKFRLVLQRHHPAFGKDYFPINRTTCQGYIPHSCAMVSLVFLALCKGPIIYDLINVYRLTHSRFVLICAIIDVTYMVLWVALWSVLTLKQSWRFRILDYVSAGHPVFMVPSDHIVRNPSFDQIELAELHRRKRRRHHGSVPSMSTNSDCCDTDTVGTIEEETLSQLPPIAEHPRDEQESTLPNSVLVRKIHKSRKAGMARVTFDESVNSVSGSEDRDSQRNIDMIQDVVNRMEANVTASENETCVGKNGSIQSLGDGSSASDTSHNISAEVHSPSMEWGQITKEYEKSLESNNSPSTVIENNKAQDGSLSHDYKMDLRNKCDEYFNRNCITPSPDGHLNPVQEESNVHLNGTNSDHHRQNVDRSANNKMHSGANANKRNGTPGVVSSNNNNNNNEVYKSKLNGAVVQPTDNSAASVRKSEKISLLEKDKKNFSTFKYPYSTEKIRNASSSLVNDVMPIPNGHLNRPDIVPNDANNSSETLEDSADSVN
ncbi:uncharacterized protein LOC115223212 isoform X2, partial [Argonauta hians]